MGVKGIAARLEICRRNRDLLFGDGKKAMSLQNGSGQTSIGRIKSLFSQLLNLCHICD